MQLRKSGNPKSLDFYPVASVQSVPQQVYQTKRNLTSNFKKKKKKRVTIARLSTVMSLRAF
jgi:hypothetical protein